MKLNIDYLRHITEAAINGCPSDPLQYQKDCQTVIEMCELNMLRAAKFGRNHTFVVVSPDDFMGSDTGKLIKCDLCIEHLRKFGYTVDKTMYDGRWHIRISW